MRESFKDKISVDYIKREILKTAFGNRETLVAKLDPRILLVWYLIFAVVPWFFYNKTILVGFLVMVTAVAILTRVSSLILILLGFGIVTQLIGLGLTALFLGGDIAVFWALSTLMLKLLTISLASIAVFASMDPERFSDALLLIGLPTQLVFGISYAYRIVPIIIDEFNAIVNAHRLRSRPPKRKHLVAKFINFIKLSMKSFYPMMLNMAKRIRTTVEGLEIRGFTHSLKNPAVKKLKLAGFRISTVDVFFLSGSIILIFGVIIVGTLYPL